ncbi:MAG: multiple sugar transport system permease protein, partial [Verrucomicrobiales bacterium]
MTAVAAPPEKKRRKKSTNTATEARSQPGLIGQSKALPYLFSFPAVLTVSAILAYPVLSGIYQSLFRAPELGLDEEWVGVENYVDLFNDRDFWSSLWRTAIFVMGNVAVGLSLGLFFAFALYRAVG